MSRYLQVINKFWSKFVLSSLKTGLDVGFGFRLGVFENPLTRTFRPTKKNWKKSMNDGCASFFPRFDYLKIFPKITYVYSTKNTMVTLGNSTSHRLRIMPKFRLKIKINLLENDPTAVLTQ